MSKNLESILKDLDSHREALQPIREILLANAMMIGEISAPTGEEEERITFLGNRFTEEGLQNISIDEAGNCMAVIPGSVGKNNILVCAHADTVFHSKVDHAMSVTHDTISGPGIGDNSLGLAALATLPQILQRLNLQLDDNLILLGATRSLGRGDLGGIRFFLENFKETIRAGICVEGIRLGRLSYTSVGMLRGEIHLKVPSEYDWTRFGATNAVAILSSVVQNIMRIPIPAEPKTKIIFGSISAGTSFATQPTSARLRFEVRSEEVGMVGKLKTQIEDIVEETANATNVSLELSVVAQRKTGGLNYGHPMVQSMRSILSELQVKPYVEPSVGELSELIARDIPSVTIGLTRATNKNETNETIEIQPTFDGLAQLVALMAAIDGGLCHD
ncbi:MAG: M28 family peptidase [Coraliomargaritaceae bacterium]